MLGKKAIVIQCLTAFSVGLIFSIAAQAGESTTLASSPPVYPTYPTPNYGTGAQRSLVERGEYLVKMGDCISCHTNSEENGKPFAGGLGLKTPFGTFYSPNITADRETGIGKWSDKDFIRAMHHGLSPSYANYFPVFPFTSFTRVSDADLIAIKAYLFNIPPVHQPQRKNDVAFPFNIRLLQFGWKFLFFYWHQGTFQADPKQSTQWNRGAYIVQGLGHCGECHTPRNIFGAMKHDYALTGAFVDGYYAPDITSVGLADVTDQEVINVFTHDQKFKGGGKVQGPMAEVNHNSLKYMTPEDLQAIVAYLKTVKSKPQAAARQAPGEVNADTGKHIYEAKCSVCHTSGAAGAPKLGDAGAWAPRIGQGMAVVMQHAINGYNSMPAKGTCMDCSDAEIKAAVDYLIAGSKEGASGAATSSVPVSKGPIRISEAQAKEVYTANCAGCHDNGMLNAPRIGDKARWEPIIKQNMDIIFGKTLTTHAKIPGITCSDAELLAAVKYIVQQSKTKGDYSLW
jgi:cytochrome c5